MEITVDFSFIWYEQTTFVLQYILAVSNLKTGKPPFRLNVVKLHQQERLQPIDPSVFAATSER
jgi:hypothetical protein